MTKFILLVIFTFAGLLLLPSNSYGCNPATKSIEKFVVEVNEPSDCCSTEEPKNNKGCCEGNCANPSCHCPTFSSSFSIHLALAIVDNHWIFTEVKFFLKELHFNSLFSTIWLPPK